MGITSSIDCIYQEACKLAVESMGETKLESSSYEFEKSINGYTMLVCQNMLLDLSNEFSGVITHSYSTTHTYKIYM